MRTGRPFHPPKAGDLQSAISLFAPRGRQNLEICAGLAQKLRARALAGGRLL
jgi:hypothetical protein